MLREITFVVITRSPEEWDVLTSFCNLYGFQVFYVDEREKVARLPIKGSSVWFLTNEPEVAKSYADDPNLLVIPLVFIPNFVRFLEELFYDVIPMMEEKD